MKSDSVIKDRDKYIGGSDIPIIEYAGIGVAMGNATPDVKAAADYVTDSVDEDGVISALHHFGVI